jgi:ketosteroid isomerase-like protein
MAQEATMRRFIAAVGLVLVLAAPARAQEWTPEQEELWEWEKACWAAQDLAAIMPCFHEDFVGWGINSTVPTTKEDRRPYFARGFETEETTFLALKPLSVVIRGDFAVLIYLATTTGRDLSTGEETTTTQRWTDVAMRESGRWSWIADHGGAVSDD